MQCDGGVVQQQVAVAVGVSSNSNNISCSDGYNYSKDRKRAGRRAFLFNVCARKAPGAGEDCSRCLAA